MLKLIRSILSLPAKVQALNEEIDKLTKQNTTLKREVKELNQLLHDFDPGDVLTHRDLDRRLEDFDFSDIVKNEFESIFDIDDFQTEIIEIIQEAVTDNMEERLERLEIVNKEGLEKLIESLDFLNR